eukprot:SAG31_NODE_20666_length_568_cov_1.072495_1_plen_105_part_00
MQLIIELKVAEVDTAAKLFASGLDKLAGLALEQTHEKKLSTSLLPGGETASTSGSQYVPWARGVVAVTKGPQQLEVYLACVVVSRFHRRGPRALSCNKALVSPF